MPVVLNVGGGSKEIGIPTHYQGWRHVLLDVDPAGGADIVHDARDLRSIAAAGSYDAIYCSHNLEHYYPHDGVRVLSGFIHMLKPDGFAEIRVPDLTEVMADALRRKLDLEDELYRSPMGPIRVLDAIYGMHREIERSGHDYYAHKTGFTPASLARALQQAGFPLVFQVPAFALYEFRVFAFRRTPDASTRKLLGFDDAVFGADP